MKVWQGLTCYINALKKHEKYQSVKYILEVSKVVELNGDILFTKLRN